MLIKRLIGADQGADRILEADHRVGKITSEESDSLHAVENAAESMTI